MSANSPRPSPEQAMTDMPVPGPGLSAAAQPSSYTPAFHRLFELPSWARTSEPDAPQTHAPPPPNWARVRARAQARAEPGVQQPTPQVPVTAPPNVTAPPQYAAVPQVTTGPMPAVPYL
ncbi:hypothetical protein N7488_006815 [Penicillium malachiteum]|nr:hypothetical protein N7488_006815 [Penicillium malachiteum]